MDEHTLRRLEYDKVRRRLSEFTSFSASRRLALELAPTTDPDEVRARLALTTEARGHADRHGRPTLGGAHDMRTEVDAARRGRTLLPQELLDIRDTVGAARSVRRALTAGGAEGRFPILFELASRLEPCPALYDAIQSSLDDEGNVLDGASTELRRLRREGKIASDRLARQLEGMLSNASLREFLQEPLITQRNGRQVLPVKSEFRSRVPGVVHDTSDSGATVFVEPLAAVELGNRCRELQTDEQKEVMRVLRGLSEHVSDEAEAIADSIALLGEIDLAFACGEYAHASRASAPTVVEGPPRFDFRAARHPLLDPSTVVPIDVRAGEDFRILLITGPNTGGKTVTLKTIGLLVLMAQSGLHVPAQDGAVLTVFDGVYVDIGDEQSIEQSLSTFSSHMTNIITILGSATERSLVLLDELGAGTDPAEGASLARALLEHLGAARITTVASTHFSELKVYAHSARDVANASVEFDLETLKPTYELTIGLPGRSNALAIAARLGLPESIVDDARTGIATSDVAMEELLAEIRDARLHAAADREAASEARRQADEWAAKLETAVRDVEGERSRILERARRESEADIAAVRETLERLLREARRDEAMAEAVDEALERTERVKEALQEARPAAAPPRTPSTEALRPGSWVRVASLDQVGEVLRLRDDEAEVQLGRLRITVPLADLSATVAGRPEPESSPAGTLHRAPSAPSSVPIEVDLRGLRVDEGLDRLDLYLDQALLAGLPFVRVIHGHGTGAMRAAVRDALAHHPAVKRSRAGERGEGGDGVTVCYFE